MHLRGCRRDKHSSTNGSGNERRRHSGTRWFLRYSLCYFGDYLELEMKSGKVHFRNMKVHRSHAGV